MDQRRCIALVGLNTAGVLMLIRRDHKSIVKAMCGALGIFSTLVGFMETPVPRVDLFGKEAMMGGTKLSGVAMKRFCRRH